MIIVFDTETTGLPLRGARSDAPGQPHLVQLAAVLLDRDRAEIGRLSTIIRPDGWTIPDEVAAIHGITTERALDEGTPLKVVLNDFLDLHEQAACEVAHNVFFDRKILKIAVMQAGWGREQADAFSERLPYHDTMKLSDPLVNMPPTDKMLKCNFTKSKPPKLGEAYQFFFGEPLEGAHDALVDVNACARIFWRLVDDGVVTL